MIILAKSPIKMSYVNFSLAVIIIIISSKSYSCIQGKLSIKSRPIVKCFDGRDAIY